MLPAETFNYVMKIHGCEPLNFDIPYAHHQLAYARFKNPSGLTRFLKIHSVNDSRWNCVLTDDRAVILHKEEDHSCSLSALMACMSDQYEVLRE